MLKSVPPLITPQLLKIIAEMGHGDELVISDANFPAYAVNKNVVSIDAVGVPEVLSAILKLYPLDQFVDFSAVLMDKPGSEKPPIWSDYQKIISETPGEKFSRFEFEERFAFYERAKKAYAVVHTGETAIYANIIIKKGVISPDMGNM